MTVKINAAGGLFRGYSMSGFCGNEAVASTPLPGRAKCDQLTLSKQVLTAIQARNKIRELEQAEKDACSSPEVQMFNSTKKAVKILKICSKIAARIQAGDKVPLKDLQYLMKNNPLAYKMAMASRKPKKDPKECECVVPKERLGEGQSDGDTGGRASSDGEGSFGISSAGGFSGGSGAGTGGA